MIKGPCPECGEPLELRREAGPFDCPHCGAGFHLAEKDGRWRVWPRFGERFDPASPLTWFEMQVAPGEFRLAVVPGQPVLFGDGLPDSPQADRTTLLEDYEDLFLRELGAVARQHAALFSEPGHQADRCFSSDAMREPSFHLRLAWRNGFRWATCHPLDGIPPAVQGFFEACRALGHRLLADIPTQEVSGQEAFDKLDEARQRHAMQEYFRRAEAAGAIARIKVTQAGAVYLNRKPSSIAAVLDELARIQPLQGGVIYFREGPQQDPSPQAE